MLKEHGRLGLGQTGNQSIINTGALGTVKPYKSVGID
jgi:hypothetical protein